MLSLSTIRCIVLVLSLIPSRVHLNIANFSTTLYQTSFSENQPVSTPVLELELQVFIPSLSPFVTISLQGHLKSHFLLTNDDIIRCAVVLDRENTSQYNLVAVALYNNTVIARTNVSIVVEDANDNAPTCQDTFYSVEVMETFLLDSFIVLQCWDVDKGNNSMLIYQIKDNYTSFTLDPMGSMGLTQPLDYEQYTQGILLEVIISDTGEIPLSTQVYVFVAILPINEFPPVFSDPMTISISENTKPGSKITQVTATDSDSGEDGVVFYHLISSGEEGLFHLDVYSGYLYLLQNLDHERRTLYSLHITVSNSASEGSADSLNTTSVLQLTILDIPDGLHFSTPAEFTTVSEDIETGTEVIHLSCETSSSSNLEITYSIDGPSSHLFCIGEDTGSVSTMSYLDYETQHNHQLTVSCSCCSSPQLISHTALFISLSDVNEFPPIFSPPEHTLSLSEHTQLGTDILHLSSTDMDTGSYGQIRYRLLDHLEMFYLHSDTGILYLRDVLIYTVQSSYNLTILAANSYTPLTHDPLSNTITVQVLVTEYFLDTPPKCPQDTQILVLEETTPIGQPIASYSCNNDDTLGLNYSINSDNSTLLLFYLSAEGTLYLEEYLDYDIGERFYLLELQAKQTHPPFYSSSMYIHVIVTAVNEYPPVFNKILYSVSLSELTEVGSCIASVLATDEDSTTDDRIRYAILATFDTFSIDPLTGQIYLISPLDYDIISEYNLSIEATDQSINSKYNIVTLLVSVFNENNQSPVCSPTHIHLTLSEDIPLQTEVAEYSCTDPDNILLPRELVFSLSYPIDQVISAHNNSITVTSYLDYNMTTAYTGVLIVSEPNSTFSFQITISILIEYINKFPPVLYNDSNTVYLNENATAGQLVHNLSAYDPDNPSTQLFYNITDIQPNQEIFTISHTTGEIYLTNKLDYELHTSYNLYVTVSDAVPSGADIQSLHTELTVLVLDTNDNVPVCPRVLTLHVTPGGNTSRQLVSVMNCSDNDSAGITNLEYFEIETLYGEYFELVLQGNPPTWYLYFLVTKATQSHNDSLFNAYFHNIRCCDGSIPEFCTDILVLVTTVVKPVVLVPLNATELALAIRSEGLENVITLFFNISREWTAVLDHFKSVTANVLTAYCIRNLFKCSILEDCSSQSRTDWFSASNVMVQDVYQVNTGTVSQLEVNFFVSLPDIPKDPEGATDYVVPGEVLFQVVNNSDAINDILTVATYPAVCNGCQEPNDWHLYISAASVVGFLLCVILVMFMFLFCKVYKPSSAKSRIYPAEESERIVLRSLSEPESPAQQVAEKSMCIDSISTLTSETGFEEIGSRVGISSNNEVRVDSDQNRVQTNASRSQREGANLEDSSTMNPFWETNPRFWSFQERRVGQEEYCVTPLPSEQEQGTTVRDTDSHITEYYSTTDMSVFSQTSVGQASIKATGKARGRYDLMELASMESLMVQNPATCQPATNLIPESENLTSPSTSQSTMLYLSSTTSSKSNTSLQELPTCSTAINTDEFCKKNLTPKKAWDQD